MAKALSPQATERLAATEESRLLDFSQGYLNACQAEAGDAPGPYQPQAYLLGWEAGVQDTHQQVEQTSGLSTWQKQVLASVEAGEISTGDAARLFEAQQASREGEAQTSPSTTSPEPACGAPASFKVEWCRECERHSRIDKQTKKCQSCGQVRWEKSRDNQKTSLYWVEQQVWQKQLRPELVDERGFMRFSAGNREFSTLDETTEFVEKVCADLGLPAPRVLEAPARQKTAWCEYEDCESRYDNRVPGAAGSPFSTKFYKVVMVMPRWSWCRVTVLHELSHYVMSAYFGVEGVADHGPEFVGCFVELLSIYTALDEDWLRENLTFKQPVRSYSKGRVIQKKKTLKADFHWQAKSAGLLLKEALPWPGDTPKTIRVEDTQQVVEVKDTSHLMAVVDAYTLPEWIRKQVENRIHSGLLTTKEQVRTEVKKWIFRAQARKDVSNESYLLQTLDSFKGVDASIKRQVESGIKQGALTTRAQVMNAIRKRLRAQSRLVSLYPPVEKQSKIVLCRACDANRKCSQSEADREWYCSKGHQIDFFDAIVGVKRKKQRVVNVTELAHLFPATGAPPVDVTQPVDGKYRDPEDPALCQCHNFAFNACVAGEFDKQAQPEPQCGPYAEVSIDIEEILGLKKDADTHQQKTAERPVYVRKADLPYPVSGGLLDGENIVFTGDLPGSMTRKEAWEIVAEHGGQPALNVTKKTTMLVAGDWDPASLKADRPVSGKFVKAMALIEAGQNIQVIDPEDLFEWIDEGRRQ